MIKKLIKKIYIKYEEYRYGRNRIIKIGDYTIELPLGSQLLIYKKKYKRYDVSLGNIAYEVSKKYSNLTAIDIGANVGDTAALIKTKVNIPVLCVEGDKLVLDILDRNARQFLDSIEIDRSFIGPDDLYHADTGIKDLGRNSSLVDAMVKSDGGGIQMRPLINVLEEHPRFLNSKLIKIDTEGFDFKIIKNSIDWISSIKPIIFFEYCPAFTPSEPNAGMETLSELIKVGYTNFLYYDNYGNFLINLTNLDYSKMVDLDFYLNANHRFGNIIYYWDICAFHNDDLELVNNVIKNEYLN